MQQNIINNFFRPINTDIQIPDSDYSKTDVCIAMANALARNTNHSLYIIDYNRKNFLYVSSNPLFLCGHSPEDVQQKGYAFYFTYRPTRFSSAVIHRKMCNRKVMPFILMSFRLTR